MAAHPGHRRTTFVTTTTASGGKNVRQAEFLIEATASQATRLRPYLPYTQAQEDTDWTTRARVTAGAGAMAQRAPLAAVASAAAAESGALSFGHSPP